MCAKIKDQVYNAHSSTQLENEAENSTVSYEALVCPHTPIIDVECFFGLFGLVVHWDQIKSLNL